MSGCVCGSGEAFEVCCGPILEGKEATTALALMRSRYTAYVLGRIDHIAKTSSPEALVSFSEEDAQRMSKEAEWVGLEIHNCVAGGPTDSTGQVDFTFRYKHHGEACFQREVAAFVRVDGAWRYKDSLINPKQPPVRVEKTGRNDPCPCGSGKKYKKCCQDG